MNRRWFLAGLLAAIAVAGTSDARMHTPYRGHRIMSAALPLDGFTQPAGAYSFRKLKSNYAGAAAKIRRTTGGTSDIGFTGTGDFDTAAASTFCAATTCFIDTFYDQSGNARHATVAPANQPPLVFNCIGDKPCMSSTDFRYLSYVGMPVTAVSSISAVMRRTGSAGACQAATNTPNSFLFTLAATANTWRVEATGGFNATAADGAWHAGLGVIDGASSVLRIDGTETTGTATGAAGGGATFFPANDNAAGGCAHTEAVIWGSYALTPAERLALTDNQRNYWIPAPLDSFATPSGAYSFRRLKSTYAGPAIRIRRASDNAETDINFLGCTGFTGCPWDEAAANAHCAATSCTIVNWYDQSGNARHLGLGGFTTLPALVFGCTPNGQPCSQITATTQGLTTSPATITPASATASLSVVANRRSGAAGACNWLRENGANNRLTSVPSLAQWQLTGGAGGSIVASAAETAWHAAQAVINGASSSLSIDGTTTAGTATGNLVAGATSIQLVTTASSCDQAEMVFWDGSALTVAEIAALTANQRSFWGF